MAEDSGLNNNVRDFLSDTLGHLFDWQPPQNSEPIGPQDSFKFDYFSTQAMALVVLAAKFAAKHENELISQNPLGRMQVKAKWRNQFGSNVEDMRKAEPKCYEGGFGVIPDRGAYKTYCSMEYWTTKEAFWLSL